jgi:Fic family protein
MQSTIERINSLVAELQSLAVISEDNQRKLDKKFRLEFSYNSNHIEGNTLTYGETELLLIFDKTEGVHEMREYEEMKAHDVAYQLLQDWANDAEHPLTETYIKQLNEIILVKPFWKEAQTPDGQSTRRLISVGEYKKNPNSVRLQNGEMFYYTSPTDTPIKMGELLDWYHKAVEKKELHPIVLAALLHYKFVLIHPFDDGNGRISRLLMNYVLLKNNLPPVIIKTADKKGYLNALNQADVGNIDAFVKYVGEQLIWSLEIVVKATKGESIDEVGDFEKKLELYKKEIGSDYFENIQYNAFNSKSIIEKNIVPFLELWEMKFEKFDAIFYSKNYVLTINENTFSGNKLVELLEKNYKIFYGENNVSKQLIQKMTFQVNLNNLKSPHIESSFNGGQIEIIFSDFFYKINNICCNKVLTKPNSSTMTEIEKETIVSDIGNWVMGNVESFLESNK